MKNIFGIIGMVFCFLLTCTAADAQTFRINNGEGFLKSTISHPTTDTITNATAKYQYARVDGYNEIITIQPTVTKISGTVAGTMKLQGSVDGTTYNDIASQTMTLTDVASQSAVFKCSPSDFRWYRISVVGSGTMSAKIKTPILVHRRE